MVAENLDEGEVGGTDEIAMIEALFVVHGQCDVHDLPLWGGDMQLVFIANKNASCIVEIKAF